MCGPSTEDQRGDSAQAGPAHTPELDKRIGLERVSICCGVFGQ